MSNLYEISARYQQLLDQDEYSDAEMVELYQLNENIEDECIVRAKYILNLQAERHAISNAITEMDNRMDALYEKELIQREKLLRIMNKNKLSSITKSPLFPIYVKLNPERVEEYDTSIIPESFWHYTQPTPIKKLDKIAIKKAIQNGIDVPGARLGRHQHIQLTERSKNENK